MGSWELDREGRTIRLSPVAAMLQGLPRAPHAESLVAWLGRVHADDRSAARAAFDAALHAGQALRGEWRLRGAGSQEYGWIELRGGRVGVPPRLVGVHLDIAHRKAHEAAERLALREVEHRAKNALSTAQALVRLTRAEDPQAYARAVDQRLAALGRAHARLSAAPISGGIALRSIAEDEFAPYGGAGAAVLQGPLVLVAPAAVQPICMALHELVTNAAKYGALSSPGGKVLLRWRSGCDGGLVLSWREVGGPTVEQPPDRRGFGLTLLDALVSGQLGGRLRLGWGSKGLRVLAWLPGSRIGEGG